MFEIINFIYVQWLVRYLSDCKNKCFMFILRLIGNKEMHYLGNMQGSFNVKHECIETTQILKEEMCISLSCHADLYHGYKVR